MAGQGKKVVLVIEDSGDVAEVLRRQLSNNYSVGTLVNDARSILGELEGLFGGEYKPDAVIVDGLGGGCVPVVRRFQKENVHCVVFTGDAELRRADLKQAGLECQVYQKPEGIDKLKEDLRGYFARE